jgi:hypothetical protein
VPRVRNTTRTVLIVVGAVLSLCCVLGIVGGIFFFRTFGDEFRPAQDAATAYVDCRRCDRGRLFLSLWPHV